MTLAPIRPGEMERRAADTAADVEHPDAGMERAGQPPAEILGRLVPPRADVVLTKDLSRTSESRCDCTVPGCRTWVSRVGRRLGL